MRRHAKAPPARSVSGTINPRTLRSRVSACVLAAAALAAVVAVPAAAAPSERGYELVGPAGATNYSVQGFAAQPDGEALYWQAPGGEQGEDPAPADGAYSDIFLARRTTDGWHSTWLTADPVDRPRAHVPGGIAGMGTEGFVFINVGGFDTPWPTIDPALYLGNGAASSALLSAAPGTNTQPGMDLNQWTASEDLSSTAFATTASLDPADTDTSPDIYVRRGGTLALVSTRTDGTADNTAAEPFLSAAQSGNKSGWVVDGGLYSKSQTGFPVSQGASPVSADGRSIVIGTTASLGPEDTDTGTDLYLWRAGQGVSLISDDERAEPGCPGVPGSTTDCPMDPADFSSVSFVGMSEDGSIVYLRTREGLLDADTDGGVDIYRYRVGAPAGQRLSLATGPGSSAVWPVSVSADGQLFFATTDRLGVDPPPGTDAVLYRWDGSAIVTVSTLTYDDMFNLSGDMQLFGITSTEPIERSVRATADGSALLFKTTGALDPEDTDTAADLYLWRADGGLTLVSGDRPSPVGMGAECATGGGGKVRGPGYLACAGGRVISTDASRVFFVSNDALTPDAGDNARPKLYEWHEGVGISLVSAPGEGAGAAGYVDNDVTGTSVFFLTGDPLTRADTDGGAIDTYVARIGGGFPEPPPPPDPCQGDACQGPVTPSPPALMAGSVSFVAEGNARSAGGKASVGVAATKAVSGPAATLQVRVPGAGRISVAGTGLEPSATSAAKAGTYRVPVRLSPEAKESLRQKKTLKVKARISYRAMDGRTASKTVSITFTTTKKGH